MENDKPIQFLILTDGWRLIRKYMGMVPLSDESCDAVIRDAQALYAKYDKTEFAKNIVVECVAEIERIDKENRHNGKNR